MAAANYGYKVVLDGNDRLIRIGARKSANKSMLRAGSAARLRAARSGKG